VSLRTKLAPSRLILGAIGLTIGVGGVLALREATLSTHGEEVGPSIELVVSAQTSGGEPGQTLAEMVEAQIHACRLEVSSDVVGPIEPTTVRSASAARSPASRPISAATSSMWTACWADVNRTAPIRPAAISSIAARSGPVSSGSAQR
jgi:hypothetical protein